VVHLAIVIAKLTRKLPAWWALPSILGPEGPPSPEKALADLQFMEYDMFTGQGRPDPSAIIRRLEVLAGSEAPSLPPRVVGNVLAWCLGIPWGAYEPATGSANYERVQGAALLVLARYEWEPAFDPAWRLALGEKMPLATAASIINAFELLTTFDQARVFLRAQVARLMARGEYSDPVLHQRVAQAVLRILRRLRRAEGEHAQPTYPSLLQWFGYLTQDEKHFITDFIWSVLRFPHRRTTGAINLLSPAELDQYEALLSHETAAQNLFNQWRADFLPSESEPERIWYAYEDHPTLMALNELVMTYARTRHADDEGLETLESLVEYLQRQLDDMYRRRTGRAIAPSATVRKGFQADDFKYPVPLDEAVDYIDGLRKLFHGGSAEQDLGEIVWDRASERPQVVGLKDLKRGLGIAYLGYSNKDHKPRAIFWAKCRPATPETMFTGALLGVLGVGPFLARIPLHILAWAVPAIAAAAALMAWRVIRRSGSQAGAEEGIPAAPAKQSNGSPSGNSASSIRSSEGGEVGTFWDIKPPAIALASRREPSDQSRLLQNVGDGSGDKNPANPPPAARPGIATPADSVEDTLGSLLPAQSGPYAAVTYGEFVVTDAYRSSPIAIAMIAAGGGGTPVNVAIVNAIMGQVTRAARRRLQGADSGPLFQRPSPPEKSVPLSPAASASESVTESRQAEVRWKVDPPSEMRRRTPKVETPSVPSDGDAQKSGDPAVPAAPTVTYGQLQKYWASNWIFPDQFDQYARIPEIFADRRSSSRLINLAVRLLLRFDRNDWRWFASVIGHPATRNFALGIIADAIRYGILMDPARMSSDIVRLIEAILMHRQAREPSLHAAIMSLYSIATIGAEAVAGEARTVLERLAPPHAGYQAAQRALNLWRNPDRGIPIQTPRVTHLYFEDHDGHMEETMVSAIQSHGARLRPPASTITTGKQLIPETEIQSAEVMHVVVMGGGLLACISANMTKLMSLLQRRPAGARSFVSIPLPAIMSEEGRLGRAEKLFFAESLAILSQDNLLGAFLADFWVRRQRPIWKALIQPDTRLRLFRNGRLLREFHPQGTRKIYLNILTDEQAMRTFLGMRQRASHRSQRSLAHAA